MNKIEETIQELHYSIGRYHPGWKELQVLIKEVRKPKTGWVKHAVIALVMGNLMHFGMRELGHFIEKNRHDRIKACLKEDTKHECLEGAAWVEKLLLYELKISEDALGEEK